MYVATSSVRLAAAIVVLLPSIAVAQIQPQSAANPNVGMLTPTTTNTAAVSELRTSLERYNLWNVKASAEHAKRAIELEPTFGLARTVLAIDVGGPTATAEFQRAATEASSASVVEALLALSAREVNAGRAPTGRRLSQLAADLARNDPQVATWRAIQLADTARVNAFRDVVNRFPDYTGAKLWLAYYLTPLGPDLDSIRKANFDEAMSVAIAAVKQAPNESATHTAVAHVLISAGKYDEAFGHLAAATKMSPVSEYAYILQGQIATAEGNIPAYRAAIDSFVATTASVGGAFGYRRTRGFVALSEGNAQQAMAEFTQILKDAEAINARGEIGNTHAAMAYVSALTHDTAGVEAHLGAMRATQPPEAGRFDTEVIVYSVVGMPEKARAVLKDYIRVNGPRPDLDPFTNKLRTIGVHRMTGLVLMAEKKPQEALAEFKQAGNNPFTTLGTIEAYKLMKNNKQADAERAAFFQRKEFSVNSTATAIIRYKAVRK